jgi:tRNA dimethylallyltransferase
MLKAGLEDEIDMLRAKYQLNLNLPSMRCVGYRQIWEVQDGLAPRNEMRDRGVYATRQLAKRQITWMTNTLQPETFDCLAENIASVTVERVTKFLDDRA